MSDERNRDEDTCAGCGHVRKVHIVDSEVRYKCVGEARPMVPGQSITYCTCTEFEEPQTATA